MLPSGSDGRLLGTSERKNLNERGGGVLSHRATYGKVMEASVVVIERKYAY